MAREMYKIGRVEATKANIQRTLELVNGDLTAEIGPEAAAAVMDPSSEEHFGWQEKQFRNPRKLQLGIFATKLFHRRLVAVTQRELWTPEKQLHYAENADEEKWLNELIANGQPLPARSYDLSLPYIDRTVEDGKEIFGERDRGQMTYTLVREALRRSSDYEVHTELPPESPVVPVFQAYGFRSTDQTTSPVEGMKRTLFIRRPGLPLRYVEEAREMGEK